MRQLVRRTIPVVILGAFLAALSLSPILLGCGGNQRQSTLRGLLTTVSAARDGFSEWDGAHQQQIIESATTKEAARAALADYRTRRELIVRGFTAAYEAIALAATHSDDASLKDAVRRGEDLLTAVAAFQGAP